MADEARPGCRAIAFTAWPFALVWETGANVFQLGDPGLQARHGAIESKTRPHRQAKSSAVLGEASKIREPPYFRLTLAVAAGSWGPAFGPTGYLAARLSHT
jgi:hypothetical protein